MKDITSTERKTKAMREEEQIQIVWKCKGCRIKTELRGHKVGLCRVLKQLVSYKLEKKDKPLKTGVTNTFVSKAFPHCHIDSVQQ